MSQSKNRAAEREEEGRNRKVVPEHGALVPRPILYRREDYSWVHSEIFGSLSRDNTVVTALLGKYVDEPENWRFEAWRDTPLCLQLPEDQVSFFFYTSLFERYKVRIPLSAFQQSILKYLKIAPNQLSPTGWGFLKGFEAIKYYLGRSPSERVFMTQFEVYKPFHDEPDKTRFVYIHNHQSRAFYEAATEDSALLEQFGVSIPSDEDFASVMRVYKCAV